MTTLPSWLDEASEAVATATDSAKVQTQVDTLTEAERDLGAHLSRLTALSNATVVGGGNWFAGHNAPPHVYDALKAAAKTPSQATLGALSRTLNPFLTSIENKALADWRAYSEARIGAVPDLLQLAGTLSEVARVAPLASALAKVLQQLAPVTNSLPTSRAFDLLDEAEMRRSALEGALQPDSVRQFLSAVARGGASLDMLTDDVRVWLSDNQAEDSFKVMAGGRT